MSGIFLIVAALAWVAFVIVLTNLALRRVRQRWRALVSITVISLSIPLSLADEIVGEKEFDALCLSRAVVRTTSAYSPGKTVYRKPVRREEISGTTLRTVSQHWEFVDLSTREVVLSYEIVQSSGGRLAQAMGLSEAKFPFLFRPECAPREMPASKETFKPYGLNYVEPPVIKKGE